MRLLLAAVVAACLATRGRAQNSSQCNPTGPRVFCGWNGVPQSQCEGQYGCCYDPAAATVGNGGATEALPACFTYNTGSSSYSFAAASNGANSGTLTSVAGTQPELGADISNLQVTVTDISPSILRVTIGASGRWTVPQGDIFQNVAVATGSGSNLYTYSSTPNPFGFTVKRAGSTGPAIFDTTGQRFMFKDQYLEVTTSIQASSHFFGLGERIQSTGMELLKNGLPLTLWTRDQPAADPDVNNYGAHPHYLEIREDGSANGLIMMSSNGMDVTLTNDTMRFSIIGGVLDMYFLLGPSPFDVTNQLTQIIGRPALPPYWSLGFMNSKYGYDSAEYYSYVIQQYAEASIPLETFVADSQYMDASQIWTLGANFSQTTMQSIIAGLHANGQRFVPIVEPVVHISPGYSVYDTGNQQGAFMKDVLGDNYVGQLWPGAVNWPDFKNPTAVQWWISQMTAFHNIINYDGLWLDMDEVSNYCTGDVCQNPGNSVGEQNQFICQVSCQSGPSTATNGTKNGNVTVPPASYFTPPFAINNGNSQLPISTKTLAITTSHYDGTLQYNAHNIYNLYYTKACYEGLVQLRQKRPFILTRSSFLGTGAYGAHWTGDTMSAWEDMQWSIPSVLNQGLAGIPFAGADICGFENYATESLCARWTAIGAWYPFCRDHHSDGFQELYRWPTVAQIARQQLGWRMRAMPYLYTAFFDSSQYGCPVMRPLFFAFPADENIYSPSNTQFLIGDGLMINPVTVENSTSVSVYFPAAKWYSLYNYAVVDASGGSNTQSFEVGLTDNAPIYQMGGTIMPLGQGGMVTAAAMNSSLTLVVAFPATNATAPTVPLICGTGCPQPTTANSVVSCGHMYLDQGEQLAVGNNRDNYLSFFAETSTGAATSGQLEVTWTSNPAGANGTCTGEVAWPDIEAIDVLGLTGVDTSSVSLMTLTGNSATASTVGSSLPMGSVDFANGVLSLANLDLALDCPTGFRLSWGGDTNTAATATAG